MAPVFLWFSQKFLCFLLSRITIACNRKTGAPDKKRGQTGNIRTGAQKEESMIHKNRGNRHYLTEKKVRRKIRIIHELNDYWSYPAEGYLRKGKIHCSCPMCTAKTNGSINKSRGPVSDSRHGTRLAVTNARYGRKNYKTSDKRRVDRMQDMLKEA